MTFPLVSRLGRHLSYNLVDIHTPDIMVCNHFGDPETFHQAPTN